MIDENPNCAPDERVFSTSGEKRVVTHVHISAPQEKEPFWHGVMGVNPDGSFVPASAQRVEDSSDGTAWLVFGGDWGVRFKRDENESWDLKKATQWGLPFLVLDSSGSSIKFQ